MTGAPRRSSAYFDQVDDRDDEPDDALADEPDDLGGEQLTLELDA